MTRSLSLVLQYAGLALLYAFLGACAPAKNAVRVAPDADAAQETWRRFTTTTKRAEALAGPFRINAALHYAGKEDSQRVVVYFWGNGKKNAPLPLRLDILLGPGAVMAKVVENERGLFIYAPRDETVYHLQGGGLLAFGLPLPFTPADLAAILTGRFESAFAPHGKPFPAQAPEAFAGEARSIIYELRDSPLPGLLTIGADGLPTAWSDGQEDGWRLTVDYWPDSTRATPRKLHVSNADGGEATLIVRELAHPEKEFAPDQLRLSFPPNTRLAPLEVAE